MCTRRVLPACAFARTWVPPWRARGSWQTQSRKIQPTSRRIQPKSRKIQPTSREIQPKSLELATSRHNNINPPQTSGRGTRAWLHIQNNRDRAVCLVSSRRGLSGRCRMCNCVCIGPRVCGIEALGTGLGTGLVWARVSLVWRGEREKAREFALFLLHMNRVSLVWRFSVARVILEHASHPQLVDGVVVVGGGFCVCVCV